MLHHYSYKRTFMRRVSFRSIAFRVALLFAVAALPATTLRAQTTTPSKTIEIDVSVSATEPLKPLTAVVGGWNVLCVWRRLR
jgi:hypothetical protein